MREIEFDEKQKCDNCENIGSYDFLGDNLCNDCIKKTDETFLSKLTDLLTEFEVGLMSNTPPKVLAEMLQGVLGAYNLSQMQKDKADGTYARERLIGIMGSQLKDMQNHLEIELDKEV